MLKKIFVVCSMFLCASVFAAANDGSMMIPITAGTHTFQSSAFNSNGVATFAIPNLSCPAPYLYPWITAYPVAYQVGHGVWLTSGAVGEWPLEHFASDLPKPVTELSVTPSCDTNGCSIVASFQYLYSSYTGPLSLPATKDTCDPESKLCFYGDGYLTVTYVAYCSTQPIPSDTGKHEPEQTKLK